MMSARTMEQRHRAFETLQDPGAGLADPDQLDLFAAPDGATQITGRHGRHARQLALDVAQADPHRVRPRRTSACNAAATQMLDAHPNWPMPGLLLLGPEGVGKSHLARHFAARIGATCLPAHLLSAIDSVGLAQEPVVVEDIDRIAPREEPHLFHLFNRLLATGVPFVLTARRAPAEWLTIPDLLSRLRLVPAIPIDPPDDGLLAAVLADAFAARQLQVDPSLVRFLVRRMHRSLAEADRIAERLDREALARGCRVGRDLASALARDAGGRAEGQHATP